jgi:iron(III) transport system ATP-binding protein
VTAAIELDGVSVRVGGRRVIAGVSLRVEPGERLALAGPSGSGKTTLLRLVAGFLAPEEGVVRLGGVVVAAAGRVLVPPEERRLAWVPQDLSLWPHLTVAENLAFPLAGIGGAERSRRVGAMLARVGLADRAAESPARLSGGERQRVALARALVARPAAVLLDEPFTALDVALKPEILALVRDLLAEHATAAIVVSHDPREARLLGDRVAVLERGGLAWEGPADGGQEPPGGGFAAIFWEGLTAACG